MKRLAIGIALLLPVPARADDAALIRRAEKLWNASCPVKPVHELCLGLRAPAAKGRCKSKGVKQMVAVKPVVEAVRGRTGG